MRIAESRPPGNTPGKTKQENREASKKASLLVVRMMEYRLKSMESLETQIRGETERLHSTRDPKKIRASYKRLKKMVMAIADLTGEDQYDAYHLRLILESLEKNEAELQDSPREEYCPRYIR